MNNHTYFNSFLFHSTYMPKNQWYQKMQINQRAEREKEIITPNFNVENFQRDKKTTSLQLIKKCPL